MITAIWSRRAERGQQFPPSDGDCHTPLPCAVREGNDTTPRACSLHVQGGLVALAYHRKAETIPRGGGSFLSSAPGAGVGETVTFNKDGFSVHKEPEFAMSAPSPP